MNSHWCFCPRSGWTTGGRVSAQRLEIPQVLAGCARVLRRGGRIGVVAITKEGKEGFAVEAYEWTHQHFPNLLDCRPIFVRRALEDAGFSIRNATIASVQSIRRNWFP